MKPSIALSFTLFVVISQYGLSNAQTKGTGSHAYSGEAMNRKDTCGDLVKPKGHGSSEYKGDCELTEALYNISATLTVSQQSEFNQFIQFMIDTILIEVNLTETEIVVQCSYAMKHFFDQYPDIYDAVSFMEIGSWGYCIDFLYVSVDLQADIAPSVVTLDANDDCELFDALMNATSGDSTMKAAVVELIDELKVILNDMTLTYAQKMAKISIQFKLFFEMYPSWKSFFMSIDISGFGSFESFSDVCHGYDKALTVGSVISGSSDSDCPLLAALSNATANTSFTISVRSQIKQFHDKLAAYFANVSDVSLDLTYVVQQYYQLVIMEPFIVQYLDQIEIDVDGEDWGTFYDLLWCSQFCTNSGSCGNLDNGLGTTPVPTTTMQPANCNSRSQLIAVTPQNTTILTDVLTVNYNTWNASVKNGFNTCFNLVRLAIWNNTAYPTASSKISAIVTDFKNYNKNNLNAQNVLMNIMIQAWQGTIRQFCNCGSG